LTDDAPKSCADLVEAEVNAIRDPELVASRREQLLDAGLKLFLEKGFASTTIRDICARSGINQASIYDYVANKQDILRRLLNRVWFRPNAATMAERLAAPDAPELEDMLRGFLSQGWTANREGTLLAYRAVPHLDAADRATLREREERLMTALAAYLRARGGLPADDPRVEVIANFIMFANAFAPMRDWLMRDMDDELVLQAVIDGMVAMVDRLARPITPPRD
jgi:AcrR family transcriptional regulator